MVTAVGTDPNAASMYHRTKAQSEQLVKDSGLQYAIVRPSLIIGRLAGRRDSKLVSRYLGFIKGKKKSVPLIDNGTNRVQPLFIGDLVTAMSKIVEGSSWKNSVVELGGPETITMREFVERLMAVLDERKPITNLSPGVAKLIAMVCERFQDQVILAGIDNVCRENSVFALTDGKPTGLDDALKTYLGTPTQPSSVRV
jgi:NADH dehydrogenase